MRRAWQWKFSERNTGFITDSAPAAAGIKHAVEHAY